MTNNRVIAELDSVSSPEPPLESSESSALPASGVDDETDAIPDPADTKGSDKPGESPEEFHDHLSKAISKLATELHKPKRILSDTQAANQLLDLDALKCYNALRLAHAKKLWGLNKQVSDAVPRFHAQMRADQPSIRPSLDASLTAADAVGKRPYYAKKLRKSAVYLLQNGVLPESQRGKGAIHPSPLNLPEVQEALRDWLNGILPIENDGFEGQIKPEKLRRYVSEFLLPKLKISDTISGVYFDGYERPDVVAAQQEFVNYMYHSVLPFCHTYNGDNMRPSIGQEQSMQHHFEPECYPDWANT
ncbi:hypothetical protein FB451DRAFT_1189115 [Mycena latifolia]|nr:hypothetical protein FB451DRAFT_1189115 [Mycena latifolia]